MSQERVIEIAGVKIALREDLDQRVRAAMESGKYEEQEIRAVAASLQPDDVVLELGTGIGLLSAYCAKRIGSDRVFTFEANPELELYIRSTYRLNGVCPRLEMCMLTDREGERDFYLHKAFWASSASADAGAKRVVRVKTRPLNEQIHRINPTILVMDVEGGEYELMQFIDLHNISRVVAEIHERKLGREKADWMIRKFYEAGFRINREMSEWQICCLDRQPVPETGIHLSLEEFLEGKWRLGNHWTAACFEELSALLPPGCRYALVDDDQWGISTGLLPSSRRRRNSRSMSFSRKHDRFDDFARVARATHGRYGQEVYALLPEIKRASRISGRRSSSMEICCHLRRGLDGGWATFWTSHTW